MRPRDSDALVGHTVKWKQFPNAVCQAATLFSSRQISLEAVECVTKDPSAERAGARKVSLEPVINKARSSQYVSYTRTPREKRPPVG
jgi:hypothetical protein